VKVGQRWQEFDDFYRPLAYGYARTEGLSHAEAEDAAQETMASVWKISPVRRAGRFKSWLLVTRWRIMTSWPGLSFNFHLGPTRRKAPARPEWPARSSGV
jgi:hypothetical protein